MLLGHLPILVFFIQAVQLQLMELQQPMVMQFVEVLHQYMPPALPNQAQDDQRPIWFYVKDTNRCGPVSLGALRALLAGGEVNADSLVWRAGMSEWQPGRNVPEIRSLLG